MGFDLPFVHATYDGTYDLRGAATNPLLTADAGVQVAYTLGTETAGDAVTVSCQFQDAAGQPVSAPVAVWQYLATAATGQVLDAAPAGGVAVGTDGTILIEATANLIWLAVSEADGDLDIVVTGDTGATSTYLITILPSGVIAASAEIVIVAD